MSSNKATDLELIICNYTRSNYEKKYNKDHVPMALIYLMVAFSKRIIGCDLLTLKEDMEFYNSLKGKLGTIKKFKTLYKASENDYSASKFHQICDGKGPTITIIKSNYGNIFGGYASKQWPTVSSYKMDPECFLYLIRSSSRRKKERNKKYPRMFIQPLGLSIRSYPDQGPTFGSRAINIVDNCNISNDNYTGGAYAYTNEVILARSNVKGYLMETAERQCFFRADDYYVIQIH